MEKIKMDHNQCRAKVCAVCYNESGFKATRLISDRDQTALQQFVISNFDRDNDSFPSGLCSSCQKILHEWISGKENPRKLPVTSDYNPNIPHATRGNDGSECSCRMCVRARLFGGAWNKFKAECKANKENNKVEFKKGEGALLCTKCYSPVYRGCNHTKEVCSSKLTSIENVAKNLSQTQLEQLAVRVLKEKAINSGDNTIKMTGKSGRPVTVHLGPLLPSPQEPYSVEEIIRIQLESNMTGK